MCFDLAGTPEPSPCLFLSRRGGSRNSQGERRRRGQTFFNERKRFRKLALLNIFVGEGLCQVSISHSTILHQVLQVVLKVPSRVSFSYVDEVEGENLDLVHLVSGHRPPTLFKERCTSWSNHLSSSCDAIFYLLLLLSCVAAGCWDVALNTQTRKSWPRVKAEKVCRTLSENFLEHLKPKQMFQPFFYSHILGTYLLMEFWQLN